MSPEKRHLLLFSTLHFCIRPPSKSPPSANTLLDKDMQFSHRYKPGVITPKLLQINIAQLSWESWILLLQADLMCQSYEPLFLTENNSSLFITSLVKPLLVSLPFRGHRRDRYKCSFSSLAWTSVRAYFCSSTATCAAHRLYFKN